MSSELVCWKCGASLEGLPVPLARLAQCTVCHGELHVCRLCEFYDTRVSGSCREPVAETVMEKERANFCGYFRAMPNVYRAGGDTASREAKVQLDTLFGLESPPENDSTSATGGVSSEADESREQLNRLFGLDKEG